MSRFLTTGIRAPDLGDPVSETMRPATMESDWEARVKRIKQNLKEIKMLVRKRYPRRCRLPVWEDDEAWWWRRRRRSSMKDWAPNVCALFASMHDVGEEEDEEVEEEEEDEDDQGGEDLNEYESKGNAYEVNESVEEEEMREGIVDHHSQKSGSIIVKGEVEKKALSGWMSMREQKKEEINPAMKEQKRMVYV